MLRRFLRLLGRVCDHEYDHDHCYGNQRACHDDDKTINQGVIYFLYHFLHHLVVLLRPHFRGLLDVFDLLHLGCVDHFGVKETLELLPADQAVLAAVHSVDPTEQIDDAPEGVRVQTPKAAAEPAAKIVDAILADAGARRCDPADVDERCSAMLALRRAPLTACELKAFFASGVYEPDRHRGVALVPFRRRVHSPPRVRRRGITR
mmetsp:Transcript_89705/g.252932  ORF Transcript_89705/g.252932 Transcript_89705/m.252932 type:complete len:205 (+) Transcript_89705:517-1131(+)